MSVKKTIFAFLIILCSITSSHAKLKITFAPELGVMGGTTEYEMDIQGSFIDSSGSSPVYAKRRITSLLEYPLDVTIAGLTAEIRPIENPNRWSIELKYLTNLNDPKSKMVDRDWDEITSKFPYMLWSETESEAKMNMTIFDFETRFRIIQKSRMDISIIAGGRYQKIEQNLFGIEGWQKSFIDSLNMYSETAGIFSGYEGVNGLYYKIEYKQFKIGLLSDIYLSENVTSQLKFAFAPASFNDVDDHLLRNKLSKSKGDGNGFLAGFNLRYDLSHSTLSYIQLSTSYNYYSGNGAQTQEWYGDDPGSPEDDTGNISSGIPHTIRSKQFGIGLQIGITF